MPSETCEYIGIDEKICGEPAKPCPKCQKAFCPKCYAVNHLRDHAAMTEKAIEKKIRVDGYLEYDRTRGVVYFFGERPAGEVVRNRECLLRIEGVPPTAIEEGNQIDIHLVEPGGEHHHVDPVHKFVDGAICAVKLKPRK